MEKFKKNAKYIVPLGFILFIIILAIGSFTNGGESRFDNDPRLVGTQQEQEARFLTIERVLPESGTTTSRNNYHSIIITFSETIDESKLEIISEPKIEFKIFKNSYKPRDISIVPLTPWESGKTYQITINKAQSLTAKSLEKPHTFTFTFNFLENFMHD